MLALLRYLLSIFKSPLALRGLVLSGLLNFTLCHAQETFDLSPSSQNDAQAHPTQHATNSAKEMQFYDTVKIAVLDKLTAKKTTYTLKVGEKVPYGTMIIQAVSAWRSGEDELPEAKVFFVIEDPSLPRDRQKVFSGWMFSSTPSINALEHPTYDLWILEVSGTPMNLDQVVNQNALSTNQNGLEDKEGANASLKELIEGLLSNTSDDKD